MSRIVISLAVVVVALAAAGIFYANMQSETAQQPAPASKAAAAQVPVVDKEAVEADGTPAAVKEVKKPSPKAGKKDDRVPRFPGDKVWPPLHVDASDYVYALDIATFVGPPVPPIGLEEDLSGADLVDWKELSVVRKETGGAPRQYANAMEAALDTDSLNNSGSLLFELVATGDFDTANRKYILGEFTYMEFLEQKGINDSAGYLEKLKARLQRQYGEVGGAYGSFIRPLRRTDRFEGMMGQGIVRASRWYFEYEDNTGAIKQGCYLFILVENTWRLLDMTCAEEPWAEE